MIPIAKPYIDQREIDAVSEVMKSGIIAQGPKTKELENAFTQLCNTKYAVAVNSGTAALHAALAALDISAGDEVITSPFTFIASANTILMQQAIPIFVDITEEDFTLDCSLIEPVISEKTKAIMPIDLYGQMADYTSLLKIARNHNLAVVEDAAQAVGAEQNGQRAGSMGNVATFSFYATKNVTSGEGGMITTDDKDLAKKAELFRQHGRTNMITYDYVRLGYNYRTTDICAAIMMEQLKKLDLIVQKRQENAAKLTKELNGIKGIVTPTITAGNKHVFHQYTVRVTEDCPKSRDEVVDILKKNNIGTGIYYPKPLHLCTNYKTFGYKQGDFPVAERIAGEVISLPVHPHLTEEDINHIISVFSTIE